MQVLENGTTAPVFIATDLNQNVLDLQKALATSPVLVVFAHPIINASRLVVGYLRRMAEIAPNLPIWIFSEGTDAETQKYVGEGDKKYLEMPVVQDNCAVAKLFDAKFLPTTYLIGQDGKIIKGYSGFNRDWLNWMALETAALTGGKPKELISDGDNKGFYELAERGPCA